MPTYVKIKPVHSEDAMVIPHAIWDDTEFLELPRLYATLVIASKNTNSNLITLPITKELLDKIRRRSYKRLVRMIDKLHNSQWIEIIRTHFTEDGKRITGWNIRVKVFSPYNGKIERL